MAKYLLIKARRLEVRAAEAQMMHVTITVGSEALKEKDPKEIIIAA